MRIVVTGRTGQLARSLVERARQHDHQVITVGRPELDLSGEPARILAALAKAEPDLIVSAAAYTAVDNAETEQSVALAVNARGPEAVARAASAMGVPLVHVSTDYVFDGTKDSPYNENDTPAPSSSYGRSKLLGELAVRAFHDDSVVLRTAWVYSPFGTNFVKTMLNLAERFSEVSVVDDQRGNPTSALEIADGILTVASNLTSSPNPRLRGTFHMTAESDASWADFAEQVFAASSACGGATAAVKRIASSEYPTAAKRPRNSRLDCRKLAQAHGVRLPSWRKSVETVVRRLVATASTQEES